jgi:hypothetical protein
MKSAAQLILVILPLLVTRLDATDLPVGSLPSSQKVTLEIPQIADTLEAGFRKGPDEVNQEASSPREETMEKSPLRSMLRSAVIPGWGQFYTGHPYRGSIFFTLEGFLFTFAWAENYRADRNWESYLTTGESRFLEAYDRHFNRGRDLMSFALAVFLINIADAYVGAHLYDFEGKVTFDGEEPLALSMNWYF